MPIAEMMKVFVYARHTRTSDGRARGSCDANGVGIMRIVCVFDAVTWREKGVETGDELRVTSEKSRDSFNDAWCVNALTFKILHDIQKPVVNIGLIVKLNLDLIQVR